MIVLACKTACTPDTPEILFSFQHHLDMGNIFPETMMSPEYYIWYPICFNHVVQCTISVCHIFVVLGMYSHRVTYYNDIYM